MFFALSASRPLEGEHRDFSAMAAKTKLKALPPQLVIAVEKLIALKTASVDLRSQLKETFANRLNVGDAVLLFALDAVACDVLLKLPRQILFDFARTHE